MHGFLLGLEIDGCSSALVLLLSARGCNGMGIEQDQVR